MADAKTDHQIPYVNLAAQSEEQFDDLMQIIGQVLKQGAFVGGQKVAEFEEKVADYCGASQVIALNSGTDALMLAMLVAGVGRGDEVITPPNSFIASTAAIVHIGARPVFVDVLPDQNIDPDKIEAAITPHTRAIMPVHLTGRVCQMDRIIEIADRHGLEIIEDAAQSFGSAYDGRMSGRFGRFGCFSAHPLKNLNALGDAGFIVTDDEAAAQRIRRLRNHGMSDRVTVAEWGLVSRMDVLQAAVLTYRLQKLPDVIERRRNNAALYRKLLRHADLFVPDCAPKEFNTFHTFVIQVQSRDELQKHLAARGIKTTIHYPIPIHLQPAAKDLGHGQGDFPVTERQAQEILTLPINQHIDESDIKAVAREILSFLNEGSANDKISA